MPTIQPLNAEVGWPADEGVIGVVGVAPWATIDFLNALYVQVRAEKDWHYPRVLCDINTKLPSRGRHLELGERDPSPYISATIAELAGQGATLAVVPCNTAHILYDRWAANSPIPVPNIVHVTIEAVRGSGARKVAVLASRSLYRHQLYEAALRSAGLTVATLTEEDQETVALAIGEVKTVSTISLRTTNRVDSLFQQLSQQEVDGVVLGCTELTGLQVLAKRYFTSAVDSNACLASAALREIGVSM